MSNEDFVTTTRKEVIVICPKCNSEYSVFERDILRPRNVECAECGYSWLHNGINSDKQTEPDNLTQPKELISEHEDDPRGDFDYPENEDLKDEWLLNKNQKDSPSFKSEELNREDLPKDLVEIDDEDEVENYEGTVKEDTQAIDLESSKYKDKDNLEDLFAELDDIDNEEDDIIVKESENDLVEDDFTNSFDDRELESDIKDIESSAEDSINKDDDITVNTQPENFTDIDVNDQENFDDINVTGNLIENDDLINSSMDINEFEEEDNDDYEEEYKEQSLFSKILNYALLIVAPIIFVGFLLTTTLNFYSLMPSFIKYSLSIIGIQNLSGLRFINLKPHLLQTEDNGLNLVIEGTVANVSDEIRAVPKIQIKLFDKSGIQHEYETSLSKSFLKSMEYEKFTYRIFAIDFEPLKIDVSLINGINKYVKYKLDDK